MSTELNYLIPWSVFAIPILGALLMPLVARVGEKFRDYYAVSITLISAILCLIELSVFLLSWNLSVLTKDSYYLYY